MPRWNASRRSRTASSSDTSPHQPVETVHTPNPTSEAATPLVPNSRVFIPRSVVRPVGFEALPVASRELVDARQPPLDERPEPLLQAGLLRQPPRLQERAAR